MGFFFSSYVIRRVLVYGASVPLLVVLLTAGRTRAQSGPILFDRLQHALLGQKKPIAFESNLALRQEFADTNPGHSIQSKPVVYASVRDIPVQDDAGRPNYVRGQLIVRFRSGITHRRQDQIIDELGGRILRTIDAHRGEYLVALPGGLSVPTAAEQLAKLQDVDFAEPNLLHYINAVPNDELYTAFQQQSTELQRWYFNGIDDDHNLNAEAAWSIVTGCAEVTIAIIDTGVAMEHPDLAANIWTNPNELPDNGIDDDGDGFVDDVHGWDFYSSDNDANPDLGDGTSGDGNVFHGTFVAGCAGAVSDNHEGITGASWRSKLMPLKVFTHVGGAPATAIADAILYAGNHGAHVINMSFGSPVASKMMFSAIKEVAAKGVILVAAAGNGNSNDRRYPAGYRGVISVGGTDSGSVLSGGSAEKMRQRASFSQFGPKAVDVVAPAVDIVSTAVLSKSDELRGQGPAGGFEYFYGNGTSFAAPLVAGGAALLLSRAYDLNLDGSISADTIAQIIVNATTDLDDDTTDIPDGGAKWAGRGRVDFLAAVQQIGPQLVTPPNAPLRLFAKPEEAGTIELDWTDNSPNEQEFRIERADKDGKNLGIFELVADVDRNVTSYTDTTAQSGSTYVYRISAVNPAATNYSHKVVTVIVP